MDGALPRRGRSWHGRSSPTRVQQVGLLTVNDENDQA
jgi:hypothetical protein